MNAVLGIQPMVSIVFPTARCDPGAQCHVCNRRAGFDDMGAPITLTLVDGELYCEDCR